MDFSNRTSGGNSCGFITDIQRNSGKGQLSREVASGLHSGGALEAYRGEQLNAM
jgi:hypothetical protein